MMGQRSAISCAGPMFHHQTIQVFKFCFVHSFNDVYMYIHIMYFISGSSVISKKVKCLFLLDREFTLITFSHGSKF